MRQGREHVVPLQSGGGHRGASKRSTSYGLSTSAAHRSVSSYGRAHPGLLAGYPGVRQARRQEQRRPALVVHGWPHHRQQPHGRPPRLGTHLQRHLPAVSGHARFRPALPERLRLPGPLDRGGSRARAWLQEQARHRGLRYCRVCRALQGACLQVRRHPDRAIHPPGLLDALGQLVLHAVRREQLQHLAFPEALHERGLVYKGNDSMPWCPRCGTGISQHEIVTEGYQELEHPGVFAEFPLHERPGEALLVWTTTAWTLTANVAAAVHPELPYLRVRQGDRVLYVSKGTAAAALQGDYEVLGEVPGPRVGRPLLCRPVRRATRTGWHSASSHCLGGGQRDRRYRHRPHRARLRKRRHGVGPRARSPTHRPARRVRQLCRGVTTG